MYFSSEDTDDYALKLIEGAGLSMSACREIAVSVDHLFFQFINLYQVFNAYRI